MEKLSKLTNSFSLDGINFSGFSTSTTWMGYIEKNKNFSYSLIEEAISLFEFFFESKDDRIMVITALSFDDKREDDKETIKRYQYLYEKMKVKNLLLPMTDYYENYLYGDAYLPANSLSFSFTSSDFKDISRLMMCHAGVIGQVCFYINPLLNIAVYPHDDIGFGCIALNSKKESCQDFLNYFSKNENFNVFINSEGELKKISGSN